ncbi:MAG TPA: hypothetical protein VNR37_05630 [Microbacteriaceae bacterium]|nr:hypothetical protein [Microbacteriaceae bacterium]
MAFQSAPEERSAWIMLALAVLGYPAYLILLFAGADGRPLPEIPFAWPMIWTIVGSIAASIVLHAVFRVFTDLDSNKRDERDRQISRFSDRTGQAFVVIGALAGLALAMLEQPAFWIANAIFLGFFLSAALSSIAKGIAYRTGFNDAW